MADQIGGTRTELRHFPDTEGQHLKCKGKYEERPLIRAFGETSRFHHLRTKLRRFPSSPGVQQAEGVGQDLPSHGLPGERQAHDHESVSHHHHVVDLHYL